MAPRQNLPIVLDYGDGRPIRSVTRTLDRSQVSFYIDREMSVPAPGTEMKLGWALSDTLIYPAP